MFNIQIINKILDNYFKNVTHVELAKKSVQLGVITSIFLVVIKFIAWFTTGSISLQASMTDSLLDALTSFFVFHALKYSDIKFDEGHNFGHEKVEGVVAIFQCLLIFYSGWMILHEAYEALSEPNQIQNTAIGIIVMIISTLAVYQLIYFQNYVAYKTESILVKGDSLHYMSDFFMNIAVITSLILSNFFSLIDVIFGVVVGCYVLYNAFIIMRNALIDLMDESLPKAVQDKIKDVICSVDGVLEIKLLRTRSAGMKKYIEARIKVNSDLSLLEANKITDEIEKKLSKLYEKIDVTVKAEI